MSLYYRLTDWFIFKGLPNTCWHCEVLGMCRHPKKEGWKFREGSCYLGEGIEELPRKAEQKKGEKKGKYIPKTKTAQKTLQGVLRPLFWHLTNCGTNWYNHKAINPHSFCGMFCGMRYSENPKPVVALGLLGIGYD